MNYGELKERIKNLGFADDTDMDEYEEAIPDKINQAISEIALSIAPVKAKLEIEQDGTKEGLIPYDMDELTKTEDDEIVFLDFTDTPVFYSEKEYDDETKTYDTYVKFNDYEIEDNICLIDGSIEGKFRIFYKKEHIQFTEDTEDDVELELPLKAQFLVPLLASYFIWLEDDSVKAAYYYNEYEKYANEYLQQANRVRGKILSGGI